MIIIVNNNDTVTADKLDYINTQIFLMYNLLNIKPTHLLNNNKAYSKQVHRLTRSRPSNRWLGAYKIIRKRRQKAND